MLTPTLSALRRHALPIVASIATLPAVGCGGGVVDGPATAELTISGSGRATGSVDDRNLLVCETPFALEARGPDGSSATVVNIIGDATFATERESFPARVQLASPDDIVSVLGNRVLGPGQRVIAHVGMAVQFDTLSNHPWRYGGHRIVWRVAYGPGVHRPLTYEVECAPPPPIPAPTGRFALRLMYFEWPARPGGAVALGGDTLTLHADSTYTRTPDPDPTRRKQYELRNHRYLFLPASLGTAARIVAYSDSTLLAYSWDGRGPSPPVFEYRRLR